ncbi:MAG: DUF1501 domain-containing protein, partial [Planctomycetota bacterium]
MNMCQDTDPVATARRVFLRAAGLSLGAIALDALIVDGRRRAAGASGKAGAVRPHFPPRARRVVFLCQSGAPSQVDLFDAKPHLRRWHGQELPESIRGGQRLTTMTADQARKPIVASPWEFSRYGECGLEVSELLPHTGDIADELCVVRS